MGGCRGELVVSHDTVFVLSQAYDFVCVCAALHRAVCHDNRCGAVCGAAALVCTKNNAKTGMPLT